MYAVIKAGGKQHKVKAGDVLEVELTHGAEGEAMTFTPLLVVDDDGSTLFGKDAAKAVVKAKLVGEKKGDKVKVFKYRPKTGYAKRQGHRQLFTLIEIQDVSMGGRVAPGRPSQEVGDAAEPPKAPAKARSAQGRAEAATTAPRKPTAKPRQGAKPRTKRSPAGS